MSIKIRSETSSDAQVIQTVTASAFLNAPHTSHTEQYIVNALRRAGKLAVSLVAEADGTVIGHVAISPVWISDGASGWFGLGPISVLPQHQRRGIGSQLMREALRLLRDRGASGCVVLGEPEYYSRFGFQTDSNLVLPGVPVEYFQTIAFDSSRPRGVQRQGLTKSKSDYLWRARVPFGEAVPDRPDARSKELVRCQSRASCASQTASPTNNATASEIAT